MRIFIYCIALLLCGCTASPYGYYDPYQQQNQQAFYNALIQAGQPSPYPVSNAQALGAATAAYNGMPLEKPALNTPKLHCTSSRTGIWTDTTCY